VNESPSSKSVYLYARKVSINWVIFNFARKQMQPNFLLEKSEAVVMMEKYGEDYGNTLGGVSSAVEFANGTTSSQNKVVGANKSSLKTSSSSMFRSHNNNNVFFYTFSLVIFLFAFSFDM